MLSISSILSVVICEIDIIILLSIGHMLCIPMTDYFGI